MSPNQSRWHHPFGHYILNYLDYPCPKSLEKDVWEELNNRRHNPPLSLIELRWSLILRALMLQFIHE